ncbi:hypothetical protein [Sphingomonas montanisoli]|uniref:Uncharacterized protein n=1 Tax=Sphingomonas montanisoli TaxID=2606412 RepID=A0A5D9C6J5_9SPHN|nr:hypothetical protein [Sphingomonas montanisoli]TZG25615.1 hypothetical protein FYJ91_11355 [Sphingomonas montanisoli]
MLHTAIQRESSQQEADRLLVEERARRSRSYTVEPLADWHRNWRLGYRFDLRVFGQGHWSLGEGLAQSFRTEDEAHAAGAEWVENGGRQ